MPTMSPSGRSAEMSSGRPGQWVALINGIMDLDKVAGAGQDVPLEIPGAVACLLQTPDDLVDQAEVLLRVADEYGAHGPPPTV